MNEYDWNELNQNRMRNDEPEKTAQPNEWIAPNDRGEAAPETEAAAQSEAAAEADAETFEQPDAEAQPAFFAPDYKAEPVNPSEPEYQPRAAEHSYNDYFYASGPLHTARPAQNGGPNYANPAYGAQSCGAAQYANANYNAPNYGMPNRPTQPYAARPVTAAPAPAQKRRGGFWKKAVAAALAMILLGGGAGMGGAWLMNRIQKNEKTVVSDGGSTSVQVAAPRETKDLNVVSVDSGKLLTASQVYKNNVFFTDGATTEIATNYWGFQSTGAAAGSGFILTEDGYILTNEHVIEDANSITVAMYDGTTYPATVVGYDANNDIAVLKIDATGLTPVTLGNSDAIEVGDEVVAIGNPLGELTFSLTKGNVSALNRSVTFSRGVSMNLIQTDAAINSGNSGGALFNMYGEVIGITNAKYSSSSYSSAASIDNIGFAIPINSVRGIVSSIIEKGYVSTPYIGVTVGNVSQESQDYGLPKGAAIRSVEKGSPAEQAGLQANDIVTAVNGETISSYEELGKIISASEVGDALELTVYRLSEDREGKSVTLTVTVGERIQDAIPNSSSQGSSGYSGGTPWYPDNP